MCPLDGFVFSKKQCYICRSFLSNCEKFGGSSAVQVEGKCEILQARIFSSPPLMPTPPRGCALYCWSQRPLAPLLCCWPPTDSLLHHLWPAVSSANVGAPLPLSALLPWAGEAYLLPAFFHVWVVCPPVLHLWYFDNSDLWVFIGQIKWGCCGAQQEASVSQFTQTLTSGSAPSHVAFRCCQEETEICLPSC